MVERLSALFAGQIFEGITVAGVNKSDTPQNNFRFAEESKTTASFLGCRKPSIKERATTMPAEAPVEKATVSQGDGTTSFSAEPKNNGKETPMSKFQAGLAAIPEETALKDSEDRGTQTEDKKSEKKAEATEESKKDSEKAEDKIIEAPKTDAPVKDAKAEAPKIEKGPEVESRYSKAIRESKAQVKELERQLAEAKGAKPEPPKEFVPKPSPPHEQYSEAQLIDAAPKWDAAIQQARANGDDITLQKLESEKKMIDNLLIDYKLYNVRMENWQVRNQAEQDRLKQQENYFEDHLHSKMPDLFDPEKPLAKTYDQIENDQTIPEYIKFAKSRPDGKLFLAKLADLTLRASSTDALAKELSETKEKLAALEKKTQPIANSTGANRLEAPGETKEKALTKFRRGLREAGV